MSTNSITLNAAANPLWRFRDHIMVALAGVLFCIAAYAGVIPIDGLESAAFVTGAYSVWWAAKNSVWNFPISIVNCSLFIILFWEARLYADMGLQLVYIALSLIGIYSWLWGGAAKTPLPIRSLGLRQGLLVVLATAVFAIVLHEILIRVGGAAPWADGILTAASIAAMTLMVRRLITSWFVWISVDVAYIWLFWSRGLHLTSVLYLVFLAMCLYGLAHWRRERAAQPPVAA